MRLSDAKKPAEAVQDPSEVNYEREMQNLFLANPRREVWARRRSEGMHRTLTRAQAVDVHSREPYRSPLKWDSMFDLDHIFKYHAPTPETLKAYTAISGDAQNTHPRRKHGNH